MSRGTAKGFALCLLVVLMALGRFAPAGSTTADPGRVRDPAVAGSFYPDDPGKLEAAVHAFLDEATAPTKERPLALVAPHAGYMFSGQIAADAFRQAADHQIDVVVILGTNHSVPGLDKVSIYEGAGYRTPLGTARINQELAARLRTASRDVVFDPRVHAKEHSVEVQVPFVQVAFPEATILPAVVGSPEPGLCRRFGAALARELEGRKALIVASSDLSHYPSSRDALAADHEVLRAIASLDTSALRKTIQTEMAHPRPGLSTCACGQGPILVAMEAARALGANGARVISYANSGDSALGDTSRVVGYGAVAFGKGAGGAQVSALVIPPEVPADTPIGKEERAYLLSLARSSIQRFLDTGVVPLPRDFPHDLWRRQGAFVTLKKNGRLRGCIGYQQEDRPLAHVVSSMALQAAFNDRRFPPLEARELGQLEIEISALTPARRIPGPHLVQVGRDGVILRKSGQGAVFLPQVATEQGWTREQMLERLCQKAGMSPDCWRQGARLSTFQAIVFHEGELH